MNAEQDLSANDFGRTVPRFTGEDAVSSTALLAPIRRLAKESVA